MDLLITEELKIINESLKKSFVDPIPSNSLINFVSKGSKYIRSALTILYLKAQNCIITDEIYNVLVSCELIHNASLLHDDVIDNAETRRGEIVIARECSSKISILSGDYLLSIAIENLLKLRNFEIIEIFKNCTKKMCEAEMEQFFLRNKIPTTDDYIRICMGKTAELFSAVIQSSALLSELDTCKAKKMGESFGICFQIMNDLEKESAYIDNINGIYTAKDVLGIEKTKDLLDNYKEEMTRLISEYPKNIYRDKLEDLIISL